MAARGYGDCKASFRSRIANGSGEWRRVPAKRRHDKHRDPLSALELLLGCGPLGQPSCSLLLPCSLAWCELVYPTFNASAPAFAVLVLRYAGQQGCLGCLHLVESHHYSRFLLCMRPSERHHQCTHALTRRDTHSLHCPTPGRWAEPAGKCMGVLADVQCTSQHAMHVERVPVTPCTYVCWVSRI